ncbi:unnamed protein product [Rotaria sordida]|uniref:Golgi apparatus protein 1 n=1 Tax=Rotaria sordida TaxID=392033 RepID=A0A818R6Z1_9BILA|nr:unnamed protein product [Rotaria sordida]
MLQNPLIFISVFVLFIGSLVQQSQSNVQNWNEDRHDKLLYRQIREVQPSQSESQPSKKIADSPVKPSSPNERLPESESSSASLANSIECKVDVQKYCTKGGSKSIPNLKVLQCIDDLDNAADVISKECQNRIYTFKYNMTRDVRFDDGAIKFCAKDIKLLDECNEFTDERGTGRLISCLYDRLSNITEPSCRHYINQLQSIIFTDWRLSEYFASACWKDITELKCGRLDDENDTIPHNQGAVIACLSKNHKDLSKICSKHIFRLHEMQSDDYHLDRALYYACREDREHFCSQVSSGNGRVYRCLYENKFNTMMSTACRKEVHRRQKLVVSNALLDAPLIRACKSEMNEHQCVNNPQDPDKQLSLVNLLLCLEDRIKKGNQIKDECRREMLIHRRMLMSDYAVSPEIISKCNTEMSQHCSSLYQKGSTGTIDQRGGRMIHCLLNAARQENNFSRECLFNIKSLMRAVDPGNDIRADPLLETACRSVIDTLCTRVKPGDSNVIMCLLDNLKNTRMTEECEDRLMEVAYFMARDWRLTPRLLGACQKNLIDLCKLPSGWSMSNNMSDVQLGQYLSCLYQQKQQLNSVCRSELKRIMSIRTKAIGLMPEIEDNCITDLATCKNPEIKGEELKCLQKKYKKLESDCKSAIQKYTKMTISDPTVDFVLMKTCEPMIQIFCSNIEAGNENDLLRCLIKNKNNQKMDFRCKTNIEHYQIMSLKDEAFLSEQFRQHCDQEITSHCSTKKTKASVIQCLANLVLQDVRKKQNQINENCRNELKIELLQRSENINLDPLLAKACQNDIRKFCSSRLAGNAQIIDCLKTNHNKVSETCYAKLKKREKLDVVLPGADYSLTTKCAPLIQKYCANENKQNILLCLRRNINQDSTPNICRTVLYHRLMILNSDARFNKGLIENCQTDITRYCSNEIIDDDNDGDDESDDGDDNDNNNNNNNNDENTDDIKDRDMGGRIIGCLRSKYANTQVELEPKCITELIDVIQTSKLDIEIDVKLYQKCKTTINANCPGGDKEDCLKLLYQKKQLADDGCRQEVMRIIREGRADIHTDSALSTACQFDILKYCNDIPIGSGKQLKCLIKQKNSVSSSCRSILLKRQELWKSISHIDDIDDLARQIVDSNNQIYIYAVILTILFFIFIAGCLCRPCVRYRRMQGYKRSR